MSPRIPYADLSRCSFSVGGSRPGRAMPGDEFEKIRKDFVLFAAEFVDRRGVHAAAARSMAAQSWSGASGLARCSRNPASALRCRSAGEL